MNKHLKEFLKRGLMFGGFGPIVLGTVYFILSLCLDEFALGGFEVLIGIISTYFLAFVQAGVSVFNQIEEWPFAKSLFCHLGSLYVAYSLTYLLNSWIPFDITVFLIFTAIFVVTYFAVWFSVFAIIKDVSRRMNKSLA